ncbi:MAG TPA: LacI family DNA-binding transcriptional regulator [Chthonomonas sp.]|uniref:LacI family DNA-binding transcriptional regulator n=1 Tax=Chthonomonas sp. TaxID=2282153 RepID=UPI002B4ADA0C|nr:LacI family DNA-binding transcriptional regulator [Chthonomonas sp.]HLI47086.1 LacI family DNA-binding transcriptional regulator [Chthonomonas sp.]
MTAKQPTLREIAKRANVHYTTAACVLNGTRGNTRVSEQTRKRVLMAAKELGYTVNRAAQQLRTRKSHVVGLLVGGVENPFFARMVALCSAALERRGYEIILTTRRADEPNDLHLLDTLLSRRPDGMILWCETSTEVRERVQQPDMENVVVIGYGVPGRDSVSAVLQTGLQSALEHFVASGRRRIAYLAPEHSVAREGDVRSEYYTDFLKAIGQEPLVYTFHGTAFDVDIARARVEQMLERPERPDALLCFNDMTAFGALAGLRHKGVRVPQEVAVIGCDDLPFAALFDPPLTTIAYPLQEICDLAVQMLVERIQALQTGEWLAPRHVEIPTRLIVRASGG